MEKYIIKNIRVGHATNSSSSHSIVFNFKNDEAQYISEFSGENIYNSAFALENFQAITSKQIDKMYYLIEAVIIRLKNSGFEDEKIIEILEQLLDLNKIKEKFELDDDLIDDILRSINEDDWCGDYNQFKNILMYGIGEEEDFNKIIIDNFKIIYEKLVLNNYVAIKSDLEYSDSVINDSGISQTLSLKHFNGRHYLYNHETGLKITIEKAESKNIINIPELVDLKITDKCDYKCEFCYQGSTPEGCSAPMEKIEKTIKYLDNLNCFEIAVAGGDPTFLFEKIFKEINFNNIDIILNTTTKNYLKGFEIIKKNLNHKNFGAIGFSITNMNEFELLKAFYEGNGKINNKKFAFQYCPAFFTSKEIEIIINYCLKNKIRLVHLGFKKVGRGKTYEIINENYLKDIEKHLAFKEWGLLVDFDQVIIDNIDENFKKTINRISYSNEEGFSSMYIDLVDNKIGLSSYDTIFLPLEDSDYETFKKNIQKRYELLSDYKTLS